MIIVLFRYLCLPYHIGYLFGKTTNHRKDSVFQSRNYLNAFLNLCQLFTTEDEEIFPNNVIFLFILGSKNLEKSLWKYCLQAISRLTDHKHEGKETHRAKISSIFINNSACIKNKRALGAKTIYQRLYHIANLWSHHSVKNDRRRA